MIAKALCVVSFLLAATFTNGAAATRVVANLHVDRLLGQSSSTAQMRARMLHLAWRTSSAARQMGLTPQELAEFTGAVADGRLSYGPVPQRLDAMSGYRRGRVYVLRNVSIPKGTMGWSLAIAEDRRVVALYVPASCGNLSMVVKPRVLIARVPPHRAMRQPLAARMAPTPAPVETAAPQQVAAVNEFPPVITHTHPLGWLAGFIPFLFGGGGGGGGNTPAAGPKPVPCLP